MCMSLHLLWVVTPLFKLQLASLHHIYVYVDVVGVNASVDEMSIQAININKLHAQTDNPGKLNSGNGEASVVIEKVHGVQERSDEEATGNISRKKNS